MFNRLVSAPCLLLAALIAACGGGGGSGPSATAPTIATQPKSVTVNVGQSATFTVSAIGTAPLSYQWTLGGSNISGATSASYVIAAATAQQNGSSYAVVVSNSAGSATSTNVTLLVNSAPTIVTQPAAVTINAGQSATFTVTASGTVPLSYQWNLNGTAIAGATSASYVLATATSQNNGGVYTVKVSNSAGTATSLPAQLHVTGLSLIAGQMGGPGYVDGPIAQARFESPGGIATDHSGNVFVVDASAVREITANGIVSTVAGSPSLSGAVDATGKTARFNKPFGLAIDSADNLYVADYGNSTVRMISPAGVVTTLAGVAGSPGNVNGPASTGQFGNPAGITVNSTGTVYVSDYAYGSIRSIQAGVVSTYVAGVAPPLGLPIFGLSSDTQGNIFSADLLLIQKVAPGGVVSLVAGGAPGSTNGVGAAASFNSALGVAADAVDNLYVADEVNDEIRAIASPTAAIPFNVTTLAGSAGVVGSANGTGAAATFNNPVSVATDTAGNVYVADTGNSEIRKVTPTGVVTTYAGAPPNYGSANGTGSAASFYGPRGVVSDGAGNLYIADANNNTIRKITPAGVVSTLAGTPGVSGSADGMGAAASFNSPQGLAIDSAGNLYVADTNNSAIRVVTPIGAVTTLAGTADVFGSSDGAGAAASFFFPIGVAVDVLGNVYVTDSHNNTIRKITPAPAAMVSTIAGTAGQTGTMDGLGAAAQFNAPIGIVADSKGNIYVGDNGNGTLRMITPGDVVSTLAGTGKNFGFMDGTGGAAQFASLYGLALDTAGNIYVADQGNALIRKVTPAGVVTTVAGSTATETLGIIFGGLPGQLNLPWGLATITGSPVSLAVTDRLDNSIIRVDLP